MLVSDRHGFVFVHLRKVAGSSMRAALAPLANPPAEGRVTRLASRLGLVRDFRRHCFRPHAPLSELRVRMPAEQFAACFKFGFVRHPLDRLVSEYRYIRGHCGHHRHQRVRRMSLMQFARYQARRFDSHQWPMLCDRQGRLLADFVGRFESLVRDWRQVAKMIGLTGIELPHLNPARTPGPVIDDALVAFVERAWKRDYELFGYAAAPPVSRGRMVEA